MAKPTTSETGRNIGRPNVNRSSYTIGLDLGDKFSHYCVLNPEAEVIEAGRVKTTREALSTRFATMSPMRVALETGTHSAWVSRLLASFGHDVIVAHARDLPHLGKGHKKNDPADAEKLARYARFDPTLMSGCGLGNRSLASVIPSWASPKRATPMCGSCWCNRRTICWGLLARIAR